MTSLFPTALLGPQADQAAPWRVEFVAEDRLLEQPNRTLDDLGLSRLDLAAYFLRARARVAARARAGVDALRAKTPEQREDLGLSLADMDRIGR